MILGGFNSPGLVLLDAAARRHGAACAPAGTCVCVPCAQPSRRGLVLSSCVVLSCHALPCAGSSSSPLLPCLHFACATLPPSSCALPVRQFLDHTHTQPCSFLHSPRPAFPLPVGHVFIPLPGLWHRCVRFACSPLPFFSCTLLHSTASPARLVPPATLSRSHSYTVPVPFSPCTLGTSPHPWLVVYTASADP